MKLANLNVAGKKTISIVDIVHSRFWPVQSLVPQFDGDMVQLVQQFEEVKPHLKPTGNGLSLAEATILAPIDQPRRNIFCVGKNYHEHAAEFQNSGFDSSAKNGEHAPEAPVIFTKPASTVIGPSAKIPRHVGVTAQLDYEAELGVVIGKGGRGIKKADAMNYVFGYTVINDFTARDLQKLHRQWFLGKSLDGFCPMGPFVITSDEVNGQNIDIKCWVNGELRQNSNTSKLIFDIPTLIETLSAGIELQPGDVIATGTPAGVGIGFNPPKFLQKGDVIRIEIQNVGVLENEVGE
ncbi:MULTISPECIES: fumarylacetoacetate hydrolase family protein [Burkholderia]|uniref:5-carboxymethyl-2-hydroxymuconate delta-isomerase n=1 Tax=Burkholderia orbicola (strain AU 1054) TaxID=331271 RepID=A0A0H2XN29_BURO1|nr:MULTISPECIES: fumarylacetoacetate hydrolase family protein [Burkholderia]ABK13331.1 5-carboxymethyl-2-hydroxymuconate delta-isomerase [Burkholderia cenocepacia HI2424]AQT54703.1 hydrolase [Burkholderia cenocepacia]EKS9839661.1 fumarylacetoacetate hydrolase family protein [Burkholderia cepacia]MBJ9666155.1 fumarylacetoacetate hydrolase family protein [Burkholderia cenocepacia]MBJ9727348.1 fumarylacetoacetate hydrolase family protein [Burkholderia cenocepacia]